MLSIVTLDLRDSMFILTRFVRCFFAVYSRLSDHKHKCYSLNDGLCPHVKCAYLQHNVFVESISKVDIKIYQSFCIRGKRANLLQTLK